MVGHGGCPNRRGRNVQGDVVPDAVPHLGDDGRPYMVSTTVRDNSRVGRGGSRTLGRPDNPPSGPPSKGASRRAPVCPNTSCRRCLGPSWGS
eukprot:9480550-Pyramimonas_sp.AAC.1